MRATNMRPSKVANLMNLAEVVAQRSHDAETHVGALLVSNKTGAILATGFNGFVRGANDTELPNTRPDKYPYMVHAEQNLIANCARHGISMDDCTVVCTHSPCVVCMRLLFQCGITEVLYKVSYTDSDKVKEMKDIKVIEIETEEPGIKKLRYEV
ncbi:hypothetical protein CIK05_10805 [Bdellovibrio sp. qaytius]|nr:hypothetical protein CIK05_10805 [Bdellovibrio sp. qaytius]